MDPVPDDRAMPSPRTPDHSGVNDERVHAARRASPLVACAGLARSRRGEKGNAAVPSTRRMSPRPLRERRDRVQPIQSSVLLVGTDHLTCQWLGLRALLQEQPNLRVLADVQQVSETLRIATDQHPDYAIVDAAVGGMGLVPLVRQMRRVSPESRVVVIGTKEALHRDTLLQLTEQGARGYLLWEGLGGEAVVRCLATVREDDLLVGHGAVLEELLTKPERCQRPRNGEPALTDDERAVLTRLGEGLTQQGIPGTEPMSLAKVERIVAALKVKFGVSSTNALCVQAGRLGLAGQSD